MTALEAIWSAPLARAGAMALIHFSWQGLLIGSLLSMTLIVMRNAAPGSRYAACVAAMFLMLVCPIATMGVILFGVSDALSSLPRGALVPGETGLAVGWAAPLLPWFMGFWVLGTSALQLRLALNWIRIQRMRRIGIQILPEGLRRDLDELRARMGIQRAVGLFESTLVSVPSVIGWLRPVVLVPVGITKTLTPPQLRAVIAHELAHVRRHDYLVNLIQSIFESILFFHPIVWWVSNRIRTEREYCCDDSAVSACGSVLQYAQALSMLEELRGHTTQGALASTGGSLMKRVSRIIENTRPAAPDRGGWLVPTATLTVMAAIASLVATGCDRDLDSAAGAIAAPTVAQETERTRMVEVEVIAEGLEGCRDRGLLSESQVQTGIQKLYELATTEGGIPGPGEGQQCRVMVIPARSGDSRCGAGQPSTCTPPGPEGIAACVRGAEGISEQTEIEIEELELGDGAVLAWVRFEDPEKLE